MRKLFLHIIMICIFLSGMTGCYQKEYQQIQSNNNKRIEMPQRYIIDVDFIDQRRKYPTGCESVSTVMALRYLGMNITVDDFIDNYLDIGKPPHMKDSIYQGCDPWEQFPGNPYQSNGWGCFAPVIMKALKKLPNYEDYTIQELYDYSLEQLCQTYIAKGIPVIFWASIDMKEPQITTSWKVIGSDKKIEWKSPMHCLLMTGFDQKYYYFNDPMRGKNVAYDKDRVEKVYEIMGSQAIVIMKDYE